MGLTILQQLGETIRAIRSVCEVQARTGIVLGSGLGNLSREIEVETEMLYTDIPHFPVSTVEGHEGRLIFGKLNGRSVAVASGRFHYYEGYTPAQVVYPIRALKFLGVETLLLSNAAGGMNRGHTGGSIVAHARHQNGQRIILKFLSDRLKQDIN